jgi:Protein of unknown function (DUF3800)
LYFAYIDESGSSGPTSRGGSRTYTLACILVEDERWPDVFDALIGFRRMVRSTFGVPVRAEIKANYLLQGKGVFRDLKTSDVERAAIFRMHMRIQEKVGLRTFAVVVKKGPLSVRDPNADPREVAWETMLQRLERFTHYEGKPILITHDEGDDAIVRKLARKARRAGTAGSMFGTGLLQRPARTLLDDPVPRRSDQSYFIQLADLSAYAAYRRIYAPPPVRFPIVPQSTWDKLGAARHAEANKYSGGPPGIVTRP